MAPPQGAYVIRNAVVTIDAIEYANQVTRARLVPDQPTQTLRTMVPDGVVQDVDTPAWMLELSGVQDWTTGQGLARALHQAQGTQISLTLEPAAGGVSAACTIKAKSPAFGGDQGQWALMELELPVIGQPVFTDPL